MTNDEEEKKARGYIPFVIRHSSFVIAPWSAYVDRRRSPSRDRTFAFDRLHGAADFCEKQHAMVRPATPARGNLSVSGSCSAERAAGGVRPCELPDQSGGNESTVPRELAP